MWLLVLLVLNSPLDPTFDGPKFYEMFYFDEEIECQTMRLMMTNAFIADGKLGPEDFTMFCIDEGTSI